eukprot:1741518-Rhodomonas_salina.1
MASPTPWYYNPPMQCPVLISIVLCHVRYSVHPPSCCTPKSKAIIRVPGTNGTGKLVACILFRGV